MAPRLRSILGVAALALAVAGGRALRPQEGFDHWKHRKVFTSCVICHAGAAEADRPIWPAVEACRNCHDGEVEKAIEWSPPPRTPTNLRFTHARHAEEFLAKAGGDTTLACMTCHAEAGAPWMEVSRPVPSQCLSCHGITVAHVQAPDTACATCHVPLPEARDLSREQIAEFPKPDSHEAADFLSGGHGRLAQPIAVGDRTFPVAPSCATCHAQDFCLECHVNAPEVPVIQALGPDPRSTAIQVALAPPASHADSRFLASHGRMSRADPATCATCHTTESCATCHRSSVTVAGALHAPGPGRSAGAQVNLHRPAWHERGFRDHHAAVASANSETCAACHVRSECLDCHRPNPGSGARYHPAGFLARHPAAATGRQADCSECHNAAAFCASCHVRAGFRSNRGLLQGEYHDAGTAFIFNHGRAARFNLESCVTCHSESDCLTCHSAQTRRFNPHGPGFDPDRLRNKNPQTCAACHGRAIP